MGRRGRPFSCFGLSLDSRVEVEDIEQQFHRPWTDAGRSSHDFPCRRHQSISPEPLFCILTSCLSKYPPEFPIEHQTFPSPSPQVRPSAPPNRHGDVLEDGRGAQVGKGRKTVRKRGVVNTIFVIVCHSDLVNRWTKRPG
jgi:hypothetical protein